MSAPTELPIWADAPTDPVPGLPGNIHPIAEPSDAVKHQGWVGERPPLNVFNWWMNLVYQWIEWLISTPSKQISAMTAFTPIAAPLTTIVKLVENLTGDMMAIGLLGSTPTCAFSANRGLTWTTSTPTFGGGDTTAIVALGYSGSNWIVGSAGGHFCYSGDGTTWTASTGSGSGAIVSIVGNATYCLATDASKNILVSSNAGVAFSTTVASKGTLLAMSASGAVCWDPAAGGVWTSSSPFTSWTLNSQSFDSYGGVGALSFVNSGGAGQYFLFQNLTSSTQTIYTSVNGGTTWLQYFSTIADTFRCAGISGYGPNILFAYGLDEANSGITCFVFSVDGGASWNEIAFDLWTSISSAFFSAVTFQTFFAISSNAGRPALIFQSPLFPVISS